MVFSLFAAPFIAEAVTQSWVRLYDGPASGPDAANDIAIDGSGNVYVTGRGGSNTAGRDDYATIKYDTNGNQLWIQRYDVPGSGWVYYSNAIAVDPIGGVYVIGTTDNALSGTDIVTIEHQQ
jgi:hypothetical protein